MLITSIDPRFGGKRTMAPVIVQQLGPHGFYFEGCVGSLAVILAKEPCQHEMCCDLDGHVTNLAWVVQDEKLGPWLFHALQRVMYDDTLYLRSKAWLDEHAGLEFPGPNGLWAYHYFIASWMGRNGVAGTERVNYQIATRWTKGGGSGPLRFRNATESIPAWADRLRNVHVLRRDLFEILPKIEDDDGVAIYVDPPYLHETMSGKARYVHDFPTIEEEKASKGKKKGHLALAEILSTFKKARVVVSYYDHAILDQLYLGWTKMDCRRHQHLHVQNKRGMGRKEVPEVLFVNGPLIEDNTEWWGKA